MKTMNPIQVGLLGIGTVGSGTFHVLQRNQEEIQRRAGRGIEITMVADLDVARAEAVVGEGVKVVSDAREVIANPEIDIVIELIGGYGIAKALVLEAVAAGKHVVTANKALLAVHGNEIFAAAREKGVMVDVSTREEFTAAHAKGSKNVPLDELETKLASAVKNKDWPVIFICPVGKRANKAVAVAKKLGYSRAIALNGGLKAWRDANMPIDKA